MANEKTRIEAIQTLMAQRNAIGRKNAHLTPRIPATTPEGHAAWHTAAMAAAIRSADTGDNDVLPTRAEDLNTEERAQLIEAFVKRRKSSDKETPIAEAVRLWGETKGRYIAESRKAFASRKAVKGFYDAYVGPIVRAADAARADWYARELNAQQAEYLNGDPAPDFTPSTYEAAGEVVVEKDYDPASRYNGGADAARSAFDKAATKAYYTLDRVGGILTANNDFIGEVAPAEIFYQASHPCSHLLGVLVIGKGTGQPIASPKVTMEGADYPRAKALFALFDIVEGIETLWAIEEFDAEEYGDFAAVRAVAQRAEEFDAAWGPVCDRYKISRGPATGDLPNYTLTRKMAAKATRKIDTALVHRGPMEHFYSNAEEYAAFLKDTRGEIARAATGANYDTADFLTMVNGLMSLLSKQSQAAGTLSINGALGPQMKGWNIVVTTDGKTTTTAQANPILTFTAAALIKEGRGGTPQKRDVDRMQRLITDVANMNAEEAQARGLYRALINRVGAATTIEQTDPATKVKSYYICLTEYFHGEERYFRIVDSWDAYLQAKRSAKGLEAKANTYVTETDMRFLFFLRTLKPGEPLTIQSKALAERIGRADQLRVNPARFRADIKAMAEAAKAMDPPLLSAYGTSAGKYTFTTIDQKAKAMTALPQPKALPPADGSADPPTNTEG